MKIAQKQMNINIYLRENKKMSELEKAKNKQKLREYFFITKSDKKLMKLVNSYTRTDSEIVRAVKKQLIINHNRYYKRIAKTYNITKKTFKYKQHYKNVALLLENDNFMYFERNELINLYFVVMNITNVTNQLVSSSINRFYYN